MATTGRGPTPSSFRRGDDLGSLLDPRSIAVVGASGQEGTLFALPVEYLQHYEFSGPIYPVNPRHAELGGLRSYESLGAIGKPVDLVLVLIDGDQAASVLEDAAAVGARAAIVFSSGFAETTDGTVRQQELKRIARAGGLRLLGPNCQGLFHQRNHLMATFTPAADELLPGSGIAYVGQSGAVGGSLLSLARDLGVGFDAWVSTGNQVDVDVIEVADALLADEDVQVILLYLEELPDGARLAATAERASAGGKPLVVLRSGRTKRGQRAIASHTGAIVSTGLPFDLLCKEHGVAQVTDVDELLATGVALLRPTRAAGRRVAVVTTSGGAGSIAADCCDDVGLELAALGPATTAALRDLIPVFGSVENPVDVTAQVVRPGSNAFAEVLHSIVRDDAVDALLVVLTMVTGAVGEQFAQAVTEAANAGGVPVVVAWLASDHHAGRGIAALRAERISVHRSIRASLAVLVALGEPVASFRADRAVRPMAHRDELVAAITGDTMLEHRGAAFLELLEIATPDGARATTRDDAVAIARRLGPELVMKVDAPDVVHKSEIGGVRTGVHPDAAGAVFEALWARAEEHGLQPDGVLVQEHARPGVELLVGIAASADGYPAVLTVGHGGTATEVFADVASCVVPASPAAVTALLRTLRIWPLLAGFRGEPAADVTAASAAIATLSLAFTEVADLVAEIEINPLRVHREGDGVTALDFLLRTSTT